MNKYHFTFANILFCVILNILPAEPNLNNFFQTGNVMFSETDENNKNLQFGKKTFMLNTAQDDLYQNSL